jgi:hypothetical protein
VLERIAVDEQKIQTLIDTHINGFNTQNRERFLSVLGR